MNLKENCQYIFNKNTELQIKKNSKVLSQNHCLKSSQTEACSVLFQISNTETSQPIERKIKNIQQRRQNTYSPWRQYKNTYIFSEQQRTKKNYLSTNKITQQKSLYKKQRKELSMKVLSQLIQFPVNDEAAIQKHIKRCSYFQKNHSKQLIQKETQSNNFKSELTKIANAQSKSVQVLHLKKNEECFRSSHNQRSVLILPNYKFFDNKPNITKEKIKMSLLKRRLNKRSNKASQNKEIKKQQNIDLILGQMLRQKLKNGVLNIKDLPKNCVTSKAKNQKIFQKINGCTKTQGIYRIK